METTEGWFRVVGRIISLDRESKDAADAVHRLVLPTDGAGPIGVVVPVTAAGGVQTGSVLLHDHTRDCRGNDLKC